MKKQAEYVRNVGKSFGYIGYDVFKSFNPGLAEMLSGTAELSKDLYQSAREAKANAREKASEVNLRKSISNYGKDTWSNFKSDIKSGKFYNKERMEEIANEAMKDMYGDLDFDFDEDFGFEDDDYGNDVSSDFDELEDTITSTSKREISASIANTEYMVKNIKVASANSAKQITATNVATTEYLANVQRESASAIMASFDRGTSKMTEQLANINIGVSALAQLSEPMAVHFQNASTFYTKSTEYQTKMLEMMTKLVENTTPTDTRFRSSRNRVGIGDLIGMGGGFDVRAYAEMVKENMKDMKETFSSFTEMAKMLMGGGAGGPKASPVSFLATNAAKAIVPKDAKNAMREFNDYLGNFTQVMLSNLRDKSWGMIGDMLKDSLLPESQYTNKLDPGNYNKGRVDWDGKSRKALMDVIPYQLSQIVSALTGEDQKIFDYDKGKWVRVGTVRREFNDLSRTAAENASYDYRNLMDTTMNNLVNDNKLSKEQQDMIREQVMNYIMKAFETGGREFQNIGADNFDYTKYGMDKNTWEFVRRFNNSLSTTDKRGAFTQFSASMQAGRDTYGKQIRDLSADGESIFAYLFNDSIIDNKDERKALRELAKKKSNYGLAEDSRTFSVNLGQDEYGYDVWYYLQGLYLYTKHISDNIGMLGGGPVDGKPGRRNRNIRQELIPVGTLQKRVTTTDKDNYVDNKGSKKVYGPNVNYQAMSNAVTSALGIEVKEAVKIPSDLIEYKAKRDAAELAGIPFDKDDKKEARLARIELMNEAANGALDKMNESLVGQSVQTFQANLQQTIGMPVNLISRYLKAAQTSMDRMLFGDNGSGELGIMDTFKQDMQSDFFKPIKDYMTKVFSPFIAVGKGLMKAFFGEKGEDGKYSGRALSWLANSTSEGLGKAKNWVKNLFWEDPEGKNRQGAEPRDEDEIAQENFDYMTHADIDQAARGRKVTKTGLVAVSEGELIIPSEYNPFYRKRTNKKDQIRRERNAINRFFGSFAEGGTAGESEETNKKDKSAIGVVTDFLFTGATKLKDTAVEYGGKMKDRFFPKDEKKEKGIVSKVISQTTHELFGTKDKAKDSIAGGLTGALIGGGVSLLTGALVGPLAGAAIGAGAGMIIQSKELQQVLFGYDQDGEYHKGLLPEKVSKFMTEKLPSLAKGGVIGGATGAFLGSPVLGAIVGSAIGVAKNSESFKDMLFGETDEDGNRKGGMISKQLQDKVKKAYPNIAAGVLAGGILGPFGLAGNIVLGSAVGYATSTDRFKKWLFGSEPNGEAKDGEEGLVGLFKKNLIDPMVGIFDKLAESIRQSVRETFHNLSKTLRRVIVRRLDIAFEPLARIGRGIFGKAAKAGRKMLGGVGRTLQGANQHLENRALRKGYQIKDRSLGRNLNSKERNQRAEENGIDRGIFGIADEYMADITTEEEMLDFQAAISKMIDPRKQFEKDEVRAQTNALNSTGSYLHNLRNTDSAQYKKQKKSIKAAEEAIKSGNYADAIEALNGLDISEDTKMNLLGQIDNAQRAQEGGRTAEKDAAEGIRSLFKGTKWEKAANDLALANDGQLMAISDSIKNEMTSRQDLVKMEVAERQKKEKEVFDSVSITIPNILKDILDALLGKYKASKDTDNKDYISDDPNDPVKRKNRSMVNRGYYQDTNGRWHRPDGKFASKEEIEKFNLSESPNFDDVEGYSDTDNFLATFNAPTTGMKVRDRARNVGSRIKNGLISDGAKGFYSWLGEVTGVNAVIATGRNIKAYRNRNKRDFTDLSESDQTLNPPKNGDTKQENGLTYVWTNGEWVLDNTDTFTKRAIKTKNKLRDTIIEHLPKISGLMGGVGIALTGLKEKLFGKKDGDKKGLLSGIIDFFVDKGKTAGTFLKNLFVNSDFKTGLINSLGPALVLGLGLKALFGGLDESIKKITKGKMANNTSYLVDIPGGPENQEVATDENGDPLIDEDGNYITVNGDHVKANLKASGTNTSMSSQMKKNLANGLILGKSSVITGSAKKLGKNLPGIGKGIKDSTQVTGGFFSKIFKGKNATESFSEVDDYLASFSGSAVNDASRISKIASGVTSVLNTLFQKMCKVPVIGKHIAKCGPFFEALSKKIPEILSKAKNKLASIMEKLSKVMVALKALYIVGTVEEAWFGAEEILGILDASVGQRCLAVIIALININLPFIGALIPNSMYVDIFVSVADKMGFDISEFKEQREEAQEELAQYNEENNTNLTLDEYLTEVKGKGGILKKAKNKIKGWTTNIKSKGLGNTIKDGVSGAFNKAKDGVADMASDLDASFGFIEMWNLAKEGDIKGVLTYTKQLEEGKTIQGIGQNIVATIAKQFILPVAMLVGGVKGIGKLFEPVKKWGTDVKSFIDTNIQKGIDMTNDPNTDLADFLFGVQPPDGPFQGTLKAVGVTARFAYMGALLVKKVGKKIGDWIGGVVDKVKGGFANFMRQETDLHQKAWQGNVIDLWNYQMEQDPDNPYGGIIKTIGISEKIMLTGPTVVAGAVRGVANFIGGVVDKVKGGFANFMRQEIELHELSRNGNVIDLWNYHMEEDPDNPYGGIIKTIGLSEKLMLTGPTAITGAFKGIGSWIGDKVSGVRDDFIKLAEYQDKMAEMASNGDAKGIMDLEMSESDESMVGGFTKFGFGVNKVVYWLSAYITKFTKGIGDAVDWIKEKTFGLFDLEETTNPDGTVTKEGSWLAKKFADFKSWLTEDGTSAAGSGINQQGFVSQLDPRYANKRLGASNVALMGCGPAAATMALNGRKANMDEAVAMAQRYQTAGGTDAGFFNDYYRSKGVQAQYYTNTDDIVRSISAGSPTVLMGRDPWNTSKSHSPFGPNNHYVVANGFDKKGRIIISDPESRGKRKYSSKILRNVSLGVGMGSGLLGFAAGSGENYPDNEVTRAIWGFLKVQGFSDAAAAGTMGNIWQESRFNYGVTQKGGDYAIGICQWAGGRKSNLMDFCKSRGTSWESDLNGQLQFMVGELPGCMGGTSGVEGFKSMTDPQQAAEYFEKKFERAGKPVMEARKAAAVFYYNQYSGKTYEPPVDGVAYGTDAGDSNGSTAVASSTTNGSSGGALAKIIAAFSTGFGKLFGMGGDESSSSSSSYGGPSGDTSVYDTSIAGMTFPVGASPIDLMRSIIGKVKYSQTGPRDPEKGSADCSSTVQWAIKKATGGIDIGGNTGTQYEDDDLVPVWYDGGRSPSSIPDGLRPNDVLFFSRNTGRKDGVGHVGLYLGNGKMIDHGGNPEYGPVEKDLNASRLKTLIKVSRLKAGESAYGAAKMANAANAGMQSAAGSGLANYIARNREKIFMNEANNTRKYSRRTLGNTIRNRNTVTFTGGASDVPVSTNSVNVNRGRDNKDIALLVKSLIPIIQQIVSNTTSIDGIYKLMIQLVQTSGGNAEDAAKAVALLADSSPSNQDIDNSIKDLKATIDAILDA